MKVSARKARKQSESRSPSQDEPDGPGPVERRTILELEEAGRLDTIRGQAALVLARRLDSRTMDTGSAVAAVVRQLDATVEAAVAGAHMAADPVDELRRRRDEKLGIVG